MGQKIFLRENYNYFVFIGNSPLRSVSPASPTSMSSSVMSSQSGSRRIVHTMPCQTFNGEHSVSEAISNISSPDYHDEETMDILSSRDIMLSDPSDSDSTILVSEPNTRRTGGKGDSQTNSYSNVKTASANHIMGGPDNDHRIVIQVKGPDKEVTGLSPRGSRRLQRGDIPHQTSIRHNLNANNNNQTAVVPPESQGYHELRESEEDGSTFVVDDPLLARVIGQKMASPPMSEDDSDIESLHSFHYSPKAVDLPSAIRLAKRLYSLDGFKKSDVSRHLSKK